MGLDLKGLANSLNGDDIAKTVSSNADDIAKAASAAADKLPVPDAIKGEVKKAATKENIEKVATKENIDKAKGLANDILGMVSGKDKK
jgi:hypothetical protein